MKMGKSASNRNVKTQKTIKWKNHKIVKITNIRYISIPEKPAMAVEKSIVKQPIQQLSINLPVKPFTYLPPFISPLKGYLHNIPRKFRRDMLKSSLLKLFCFIEQ